MKVFLESQSLQERHRLTRPAKFSFPVNPIHPELDCQLSESFLIAETFLIRQTAHTLFLQITSLWPLRFRKNLW